MPEALVSAQTKVLSVLRTSSWDQAITRVQQAQIRKNFIINININITTTTTTSLAHSPDFASSASVSPSSLNLGLPTIIPPLEIEDKPRALPPRCLHLTDPRACSPPITRKWRALSASPSQLSARRLSAGPTSTTPEHSSPFRSRSGWVCHLSS